MDITIEQGAYVMNHADVLHETDDFVVAECEGETKYVGWISVGTSDDETTVMIWPEEGRSLYVDESAEREFCTVVLPLGRGWTVLAEGEKWLTRIVAYRRTEGTRAWQK